MRVLYSVLNRFVNVSDLSPEDVADRLTMGGLEVEGVEYLGDSLRGCVVALVKEVVSHPSSKKLKVLRVHDGSSDIQVVCGAPNVREGLKVALALPGAVLPTGDRVEAVEILGVKSEGMLLSEIELGLEEEAGGILELPEESVVGDELAEYVYMDDYVLEVSPTPNRGDCFGVLGVAREVAAIFERELVIPEVKVNEELDSVNEYVSIEIEDPNLCPRYVGRYIEGVEVGDSPLWMKVAVKAFGMRPISNVVDVTNYVLMEVGHPLHAFDFDRLKEGRIVVRRARQGEFIVTLDGEYRELDGDTLVIADGKRPVAIAGVMGGANSEVTSNTKRVLLESAYFDPVSIRRTSKRLGLSTEASKRFERGTDIEALVYAADRAAQLIVDVANGKVAKGRYDVYPKPFEKRKIYVSFEKISGLLGVEISEEEAERILFRLGFDVEKKEDGFLVGTPPHRILDVTRDVDVVEEVARIWGYHRVPAVMPSQPLPSYEIESDYPFVERVKSLMVSAGLVECINYSFIPSYFADRLKLPEDDERRRYVKLLNPLSEEMSVMRTTLLFGLLDTASRNHRVRAFDLSMFEIGRVFFLKQEIEERLFLGMVFTGSVKDHWSQSSRKYDFYDAKGVVEALGRFLGLDFAFVPSKEPFLHPGQSADVVWNRKVIGYVGVLHPDIVEDFELKHPAVVAEVDLEHLKNIKRIPTYRSIPKYPETTRDLSFIVPKTVSYDQVLSEVLRDRPSELARVKLIDVYKGKGIPEDHVSMTLSFVFVSHERTLSDEEVDQIFWSIAERLEKNLPLTIRGKKDR